MLSKLGRGHCLSNCIAAALFAAVSVATIVAAYAQEPPHVIDDPAPEGQKPQSGELHPPVDNKASPDSPQDQQPRPATAEVAPAPPAEIDPIVALVRQRLAERYRGEGFDRSDREALRAFYAEPGRSPMWVISGELSRRARDVMAEIGRARGVGTFIRGVSICPMPKSSRASQAALADAEIKLGLAVLKYARHARGGRVDPLQTGQSSDHKAALIAPKTVLHAIGTAPRSPTATCAVCTQSTPSSCACAKRS